MLLDLPASDAPRGRNKLRVFIHWLFTRNKALDNRRQVAVKRIQPPPFEKGGCRHQQFAIFKTSGEKCVNICVPDCDG